MAAARASGMKNIAAPKATDSAENLHRTGGISSIACPTSMQSAENNNTEEDEMIL